MFSELASRKKRQKVKIGNKSKESTSAKTKYALAFHADGKKDAKKKKVTMPVECRGARSSHNIPAVDSVEILPIFHKLLEDKRSTPIVGGSR